MESKIPVQLFNADRNSLTKAFRSNVHIHVFNYFYDKSTPLKYEGLLGENCRTIIILSLT